MNSPPRICVVGSSNIDLFFRAPRLPKTGETLAGSDWRLGYGGKGANQAVMAARLGAQVSMVSCIGQEVFGEGVLKNFKAEGVDTTYVCINAHHPTGLASIVVDDAARNCILLVPGANQHLTPQNVRTAASAIETASVVLCQLEVPLETTLEAFRVARAAKVLTILNPAPAASFPDELLALSDYCIPNETEIELLTGLPVHDLIQAEAAAKALLLREAGTVILTLGDQGALIVSQNESCHMPAVSVQAVDTTGAGDAFIGSLAVFLAQKAGLREAVRKANAVAALSVTAPGTQMSFPQREAVDSFLKSLAPP